MNPSSRTARRIAAALAALAITADVACVGGRSRRETARPATAALATATESTPMGTPEAAGTADAPLGVIRESLFGEASADDWTPISWRDLFTEGWNEPFVFAPPSDSGALRQEWINAANGVFYRQWVLDYAYRNHVGSQGDRDLGSWFIFAPLNRRLEILLTVPFVDYRRSSGGATSIPGGMAGIDVGRPAGRYRATFGDLSVTPQVLIHETKNTSIMGIMTVRTPTGTRSGGNGHMTLSPQLQFWQGLPRRWVVRGGFGPTVPLDATGQRTTLDSNLTIGKFLTTDEVRYFKEFTVYLAANVSTAVDDRGPGSTALTLLPGLRFRLAPDYWFLSGIELSPVGPGREDYAMFFRLVKRY